MILESVKNETRVPFVGRPQARLAIRRADAARRRAVTAALDAAIAACLFLLVLRLLPRGQTASFRAAAKKKKVGARSSRRERERE